MKRYAPNQHVPMKFHNLYVYLLNPLGILLRAAIAALILLTALNVAVVPAQYQPFDDLLANSGNLALWLVFGVSVLALLFAIVSEVLLARRRPLGVIILIFNYLLDLATTGLTAWKQPTTENLISAAIVLLISILVCIYYWKRRRLFK